ncbi:hypothetical protein [Alkalicoccus daliensis]|uniref:hypothetical protein n=1 Tax=Alkalicoccus daliensis TaxID=745820 RepID=UPI000B89C64A|nr:hypothetical protein [Alkalicoccus daliensis]
MQGNKILIFLPLLVMLGLFAIGYYSLTQTGGFTNTDLEENIFIAYEREENQYIEWQWGSFPEDGIAGTDYIELVIDADAVEEVELRLQQAGEILYETSEWEETPDGIAVEFPTYADGEQIIGALGELLLDASADIDAVRYYHTWAAAEINVSSSESIQELLEERIPDQFWVVEEPV